jgi:hypothetical protein
MWIKLPVWHLLHELARHEREGKEQGMEGYAVMSMEQPEEEQKPLSLRIAASAAVRKKGPRWKRI